MVRSEDGKREMKCAILGIGHKRRQEIELGAGNVCSYRLLTLVLDSRYQRLNSIPPEISMAKPPWNSTAARRPDCRGITCETDRKRNVFTWMPALRNRLVGNSFWSRISRMIGTKSHVSFSQMRQIMDCSSVAS